MLVHIQVGKAPCSVWDYTPYSTTTTTVTTITTTTTTTPLVFSCEYDWPLSMFAGQWDNYCADPSITTWAMSKDCSIAWPGGVTAADDCSTSTTKCFVFDTKQSKCGRVLTRPPTTTSTSTSTVTSTAMANTTAGTTLEPLPDVFATPPKNAKNLTIDRPDWAQRPKDKTTVVTTEAATTAQTTPTPSAAATPTAQAAAADDGGGGGVVIGVVGGCIALAVVIVLVVLYMKKCRGENESTAPRVVMNRVGARGSTTNNNNNNGRRRSNQRSSVKASPQRSTTRESNIDAAAKGLNGSAGGAYDTATDAGIEVPTDELYAENDAAAGLNGTVTIELGGEVYMNQLQPGANGGDSSDGEDYGTVANVAAARGNGTGHKGNEGNKDNRGAAGDAVGDPEGGEDYGTITDVLARKGTGGSSNTAADNMYMNTAGDAGAGAGAAGEAADDGEDYGPLGDVAAKAGKTKAKAKTSYDYDSDSSDSDDADPHSDSYSAAMLKGMTASAASASKGADGGEDGGYGEVRLFAGAARTSTKTNHFVASGYMAMQPDASQFKPDENENDSDCDI